MPKNDVLSHCPQPQTNRDGIMYLTGVVWAAQKAAKAGSETAAREILALSGTTEERLKHVAEELYGVDAGYMSKQIERAYTSDLQGSIQGFVGGKQVTHAYGTGDGWALYHYDGEDEYPPADEMEVIEGWPEYWPPWLHGKWLRRFADVTIV